MPAAAVASRTPAIAGMSGTVLGASGEMAVTGKLITYVMPGTRPGMTNQRFVTSASAQPD
jgi:hypothetical protein